MPVPHFMAVPHPYALASMATPLSLPQYGYAPTPMTLPQSHLDCGYNPEPALTTPTPKAQVR